MARPAKPQGDPQRSADLIAAASLCTPETISFMAVHARGLICAPITQERAEELEGSFAIVTDPASGTVIQARLPLADSVKRNEHD